MSRNGIDAELPRQPRLDEIDHGLRDRLGLLDRHACRSRRLRPAAGNDGNSSLVDLVRAAHDARRGRLAEHLGQADDRHRRRSRSGRSGTGPARPRAVDPRRRRRSPRCGWRTALSSWLASGTSIIEHSSATSRSQSSGESCVALELPVRRIHLQQPVDGLGLQAGRFRQPLGSAAGGGAQQGLDLLGAQDGQDGVDQRRLADARAAGDDEQLRRQRQANGVLLAVGQLDRQLVLDPGDGLVGVRGRPGGRARPAGA